MEIKRITMNQYMQFSKYYYSWKGNPMRLGQAFLNMFYPGIIDTKLFYCDNDLLSQQIIFEKYITIKEN